MNARLFLWVVCAVAAAAPCAAQGFVADGAVTEACLAGGTTTPDRRFCIGQAAQICADATTGGFTTRSMTACLQSEHAYWDAALNQSYQHVLSLAKEADRANAGGQSGTKSIEQHLREMQRAWISYRDATCAFEQRQYEGGSIAALIAVDCRLTLTAEQVFRLQDSVLGL